MYVPLLYSLSDDEAWDVVETAGAGFLVAASAGQLHSAFVPVLANGEHRLLRAHVARANSWCSVLRDNDHVTALFNVASAYVSPNNHVSKRENPAVVPTWDYVVAQIEGRLRIRDDVAWKRSLVIDMTTHFERSQSAPWSVSDAPASYVEKLLDNIVGVEIAVVAVTASAKLSQNQPPQNQQSVRENFEKGTPREQEVARKMNSAS